MSSLSVRRGLRRIGKVMKRLRENGIKSKEDLRMKVTKRM